MNANNIQTPPKIKRETKNKIKVEFDRTPLIERLQAKLLNINFVINVLWYIFRLLFLIGVSYVILFPFFAKISASFMSPEDFVDVTVQLIPKAPTLATYTAIIKVTHMLSRSETRLSSQAHARSFRHSSAA